MKNFIICITLFCIVKVFSQKTDGICNMTDKIGYPITNLSVEFYKSDTYIKKRYSQFSDVMNLSPEELLRSHISAQNNEWLSYNYGKKVNWEYDKIKELINDNNYIELLFKLNFKVLNKEYSIIKLNAKNNSNSSIPVAFLMEKKDGRWIFTDNKILQNLKLTIYLLTLEDIYSVFNNKKSNKNLQLNTLIDKIWSNNSFNFYAFINGFGEYLLRNDTKNNNIPLHLKEDYLMEIKNDGIIPLFNQEFCFYFENEISEMNSSTIDKAINSIKKITGEKIYPLNSIKIKIDEQDFFYLKYVVVNDDKTSDNVKVFDESFNIINRLDKIFTLLKTNNQEKLKDLFLNSKEFIVYE